MIKNVKQKLVALSDPHECLRATDAGALACMLHHQVEVCEFPTAFSLFSENHHARQSSVATSINAMSDRIGIYIGEVASLVLSFFDHCQIQNFS